MIVGGAELFVEEVVTVAEARRAHAGALPRARAAGDRAPGEVQQRALDKPRQGHPCGRQHHWGEGVQSTVPIAFGLAVTGWDLDRFAVAAGIAGLAGGALALWRLPKDRLGIPVVAAWSALFAGFVAFAALGP